MVLERDFVVVEGNFFRGTVIGGLLAGTALVAAAVLIAVNAGSDSGDDASGELVSITVRRGR